MSGWFDNPGPKLSVLLIWLLFSQVSALLGRIPSAVGYQPTLATDMGTMQERITTTKKGSITSVQVRFLPSVCMAYTLALPGSFHVLKCHFSLTGHLRAC